MVEITATEHSKKNENKWRQPKRPFSLVQFSPVTQSCLTLCNPMDWGQARHARPPCPSPTLRACSNSCPSSLWCHPIISSSVIPFSSCLQSFPASGAFQMSQFFAPGGQSIGVSASTSLLPMNIQDWFPLGLTGWISLQSQGLSRVFSNTTVQKASILQCLAIFTVPTLTSTHEYWKNHSFVLMDLCWESNVSAF